MAKPRRTKHKQNYMRPIFYAPSNNCGALIYKISVFYKTHCNDLTLEDAIAINEMVQTIKNHKEVLPDKQRSLMHEKLKQIQQNYR